jgi:predicted dehydrogenase
MTEPLRIGILGATRIAARAVIEPARAIGATIVAVAARDEGRARSYAAEHGIGRAYGGYEALLADPEVEVVYNPSPNSEHVRWTLAAMRAGKHVLSEKPFASNANEARLVAAEPNPGSLVVFEGFHHLYHPAHQRLLELVRTGALGEVTRLEVRFGFACEDLSDIRWSWPLSGGSLMDLGCYDMQIARSVAQAMGGDLRLVSATMSQHNGADPRVDATARVEGSLPNGAPVVLQSSLVGPADCEIVVTGTRGSVRQPQFITLERDDRLFLSLDGVDTVEHHGLISTYTFQLRALEAAIRDRAVFPTDVDNAIANMEFLDECYRLASLPPRQSALT